MCVCVCVCVCEREQDESCNRHTHHGMCVVVHYSWPCIHLEKVRRLSSVAARPYLVGSQAIKAASYKVFAAV